MQGLDHGAGLDLSIVICTCDRYDVLPDALRSIETQSLGLDRFELVVVDNSTDPEARARFIGGLQLVCSNQYLIQERAHLARARNVALEVAQGGLVAFIDDDALADPGWAAAIVARFAADASAAMVGGPVVPIWPGHRPAWWPDTLDWVLTIVDHGPEPHRLGEGALLAGTNMAVRRHMALAAGGFDEALGRMGPLLLSNEDLQLMQSLRRAGHAIVYDPAVRVRHRIHPQRLTQDWLRRRIAWQALSDIISEGGRGAGNRDLERAALEAFASYHPPEPLAAMFADVLTPQELLAQADAIRATLRLLLG